MSVGWLPSAIASLWLWRQAISRRHPTTTHTLYDGLVWTCCARRRTSDCSAICRIQIKIATLGLHYRPLSHSRDCRLSTRSCVPQLPVKMYLGVFWMIQNIDLCLIITPPSVWEQSIAMSVSVCLCACRSVYPRAYRAYIRKYISNLDQFLWMLPMAVAQSSSGGVAIRCVLPVLWLRHICT